MNKYYSRLSRIFFPERCERCGKIIPVSCDFCEKCEENITAISEDFCQHCGQESGLCICGDETNAHIEHITAVYLYSGDIREKIHAMKFRGRLHLINGFGEAMAKRIRSVYGSVHFDGVCFVPMSSEGEKERGYNQSRLLAKSVAHNLGVPFIDCLAKTKLTQKQHSLTGFERRENVKGSFSLSTPAEVEGKTLILCDDIKTTGSTLNECVKVMMAGGVREVYCVCIAVADYKGVKN